MENYLDAENNFTLAIEIARELKLLPIQGMSYAGLGIVRDEQGCDSEAMELFRLAANIFDQIGQVQYKNSALHNLAIIERRSR